MAGRPEVVHVRHFVGVDEREVGMRKFLAKHAAATTGTLSCFDRLLFFPNTSAVKPAPGMPASARGLQRPFARFHTTC